jgi:hypothetical protein
VVYYDWRKLDKVIEKLRKLSENKIGQRRG